MLHFIHHIDISRQTLHRIDIYKRQQLDHITHVPSCCHQHIGKVKHYNITNVRQLSHNQPPVSVIRPIHSGHHAFVCRPHLEHKHILDEKWFTWNIIRLLLLDLESIFYCLSSINPLLPIVWGFPISSVNFLMLTRTVHVSSIITSLIFTRLSLEIIGLEVIYWHFAIFNWEKIHSSLLHKGAEPYVSLTVRLSNVQLIENGIDVVVGKWPL